MTPINHQTTALIEEHVRHLISIMGFTRIRVSCFFRDVRGDQCLHIAIDVGSSGRLLIGARGAHLFALQHIVHSLMRRQLKEPCRVIVDVNGYLAGRERALLRLAEEAARKAGRTGQAVILPPMPAAERRTIHNSLASRRGVNTESLGEEPNRRVAVRSSFI